MSNSRTPDVLQPEQKHKMNETLRNFFSGSLAGATVAYTLFPLEGLKKYFQSGQTGKFHPYRGSTMFAANIIPATTIQLVTDGQMQKFVPDDASTITKLLGSAYCGVTGATVATTVENVVIRQQMLSSGPWHAVKDMLAQGWLRPWKSFPLIATRDGIFTACMLTGNDAAAKFAKDNFGSWAVYPSKLMLSFVGAALSHPFDTTATNMQKTHQPMSMFQSAVDIVNKYGYKGFYRGFAPRFGLFFTFTNVIPFVKNEADKFLDKSFGNAKVSNSSSAMFGGSQKTAPKMPESTVKIEEVVEESKRNMKKN